MGFITHKGRTFNTDNKKKPVTVKKHIDTGLNHDKIMGKTHNSLNNFNLDEHLSDILSPERYAGFLAKNLRSLPVDVSRTEQYRKNFRPFIKDGVMFGEPTFYKIESINALIKQLKFEQNMEHHQNSPDQRVISDGIKKAEQRKTIPDLFGIRLSHAIPENLMRMGWVKDREYAINILKDYQ